MRYCDCDTYISARHVNRKETSGNTNTWWYNNELKDAIRVRKRLRRSGKQQEELSDGK